MNVKNSFKKRVHRCSPNEVVTIATLVTARARALSVRTGHRQNIGTVNIYQFIVDLHIISNIYYKYIVNNVCVFLKGVNMNSNFTIFEGHKSHETFSTI